MFKFGFSDSHEDDLETKDSAELTTLIESKEIIPHKDMFNFDINYNSFNCKNGVLIKHISTESIIKTMDKKSDTFIVQAEKNNSDLITGVYEGGLKIWECTKDLIDFLSDENIDLSNKNVLDLGCGVGIVGIYTILKGANTSFQDYNPEVITSGTIPNVFLNVDNINDVSSLSRFYSGDWESFLKVVENNIFDYIFTSETIYNVENYKKLHGVFKKCLKKNGTVYIAAKTYYFGVGGGLRSFEEFLTKEQCFECSSVWKCYEGINREILKVNWKPTITNT